MHDRRRLEAIPHNPSSENTDVKQISNLFQLNSYFSIVFQIFDTCNANIANNTKTFVIQFSSERFTIFIHAERSVSSENSPLQTHPNGIPQAVLSTDDYNVKVVRII